MLLTVTSCHIDYVEIVANTGLSNLYVVFHNPVSEDCLDERTVSEKLTNISTVKGYSLQDSQVIEPG